MLLESTFGCHSILTEIVPKRVKQVVDWGIKVWEYVGGVVGCYFLVEYTFGYCAPEFDYFQKGKNNIGLLFVCLVGLVFSRRG